MSKLTNIWIRLARKCRCGYTVLLKSIEQNNTNHRSLVSKKIIECDRGWYTVVHIVYVSYVNMLHWMLVVLPYCTTTVSSWCTTTVSSWLRDWDAGRSTWTSAGALFNLNRYLRFISDLWIVLGEGRRHGHFLCMSKYVECTSSQVNKTFIHCENGSPAWGLNGTGSVQEAIWQRWLEGWTKKPARQDLGICWAIHSTGVSMVKHKGIVYITSQRCTVDESLEVWSTYTTILYYFPLHRAPWGSEIWDFWGFLPPNLPATI